MCGAVNMCLHFRVRPRGDRAVLPRDADHAWQYSAKSKTARRFVTLGPAAAGRRATAAKVWAGDRRGGSGEPLAPWSLLRLLCRGAYQIQIPTQGAGPGSDRDTTPENAFGWVAIFG